MTLNTCPFCGEKVHLNSMKDDDGTWFYLSHRRRGKEEIRCRVVMESEKFRFYATDDEIKAARSGLIEMWNRRCERE